MENKNPKDEKRVCLVRLCDFSTYYNYEYEGNSGRLVITPITDRAYFAISQILNLTMGISLNGPVGSGKAETVKDFAKNLGINCVCIVSSD